MYGERFAERNIRNTDARIAAVAGRQLGVITTAQLLAAGLDRPAISRRVRTGRFHSLYRGVYAVGHSNLPREAKWLAAVPAAGENAALSHLAAATHWRMWRRGLDGIDVLVRVQRRCGKGFRIHTCRALGPEDTTVHRAIPVTTPARTLVDLQDVLTRHQLANAIHEAAFHRLYDPTTAEAAIARAPGAATRRSERR